MDELHNFVVAFAETFDETPVEDFAPETEFHKLDEWTSINGLAILNMIGKKYGVKLLPQELRSAITIEDVFKLVVSKK